MAGAATGVLVVRAWGEAHVRFRAVLVACALAAVQSTSLAAPTTAVLVPTASASLRAQYSLLQPALLQNEFNQPLVVRSEEGNGKMVGEVFAVVDFPLAQLIQGLNGPSNWCDIMILHINTKYCRPKYGPQGVQLALNIGKKTPENLMYTQALLLNYQAFEAGPDYLNIGLTAKDGPVGTSDYDIALQAVSLPGERSFLHLSYSYRVNMIGKLALQAYLQTAGRNKVGFSIQGRGANGQPILVAGARGLVERNTMRYYLAINAFLAAQQLPAPERQAARLLNWIQATERYPVQLEEMDRTAYLEMKRTEVMRQQSPR